MFHGRRGRPPKKKSASEFFCNKSDLRIFFPKLEKRERGALSQFSQFRPAAAERNDSTQLSLDSESSRE